MIRYFVPSRCMVTLDVYSVSGHRVARLYEGQREAGLFAATWNGCSDDGVQMSSGVYLYRLTAGKETLSRKMILLR
jgi:flagellar hook assembly protein FlgD